MAHPSLAAIPSGCQTRLEQAKTVIVHAAQEYHPPCHDPKDGGSLTCGVAAFRSGRVVVREAEG